VLPAILILALVFGFLFLTRLGAAYRVTVAQRWPVFLLAGAAILAFARGAIWPAVAMASLAALGWILWPAIERARRPNEVQQKVDTPEDSAARALLGVGPNAMTNEIRSAYRAKIAHAHPDRGGSHNEAARLTAARDRLLKKLR
jgi:DnaJ-domain-containing protein 1